EAVLDYEPLPDTTLLPPTSKERPLISKYGTCQYNTVTHPIVELYAAGQHEAIGFLPDNRAGGMPCFGAVADFYSSKHMGKNTLAFVYI
ncbi:hypothetical protein L914_20108, partial [Phytophthora nicotianae]